MIIYVTIWALALSIPAAVLVHEGGTPLLCDRDGLTPRVLMLGLGPVVLRLRKGPLAAVLRVLPVAGYLLIQPTDRRWAHGVMIAGGPLANLLALAACLRAHALWPGVDPLLAPAIYQGVFAAATLLPLNDNVGGLQRASDGAQLYRLLRKARTPPVTSGYAAVMASVEPPGAPARSPTRHAARLLFELQHLRADQDGDALACRDANRSLRGLLDEGDLTSAERAFTSASCVPSNSPTTKDWRPTSSSITGRSRL